MVNESGSGSTLVYPKSLLKESDMLLNHNEMKLMYYNDEETNQYVFQNNF